MQEEIIDEVEVEEEIESNDDYYGFDDSYIYGSSSSSEKDTDENTKEEIFNNSETEESVSEQETNTDINNEEVNELNYEIPNLFKLDEQVFNKQFKTEKDEADFYKKALMENHKILKNDVIPLFLENYEKELISREQEVDKLIEIKNAMSGQPETFLRKYFGNHLKQMGYNLKYTEDEINNIIHRDLTEKFGENYLNEYDPNQLKLATSKSSQIEREKNRIFDQLNKENEQFSKQSSLTQIAPEIRENYFNNEYNKFKKFGVPKEEYDNFVKQAAEYTSKMDLIDMYKLVNFDTIVEAAKQEGKKSLYKEIQKAGGKPVKSENTFEKQKTFEMKTEADFYSQKRKKSIL